jgi:copper chaperone NosL
MKAFHFIILALGFQFTLLSCKVEPQAIRYGEDMCHFCWMTIVDRSHGTEVVTRKGKAYKFDSIECLLNFKKSGEVEEEDIALYLVNDLYSEGELVDAVSATYLKCDLIPSPMGGYLSAFESRDRAEDVHREMGGTIYSWTELQDSFAGYLDFEN